MSPSTQTPPSPTSPHDTVPTDLLLSYLHTTNHLDTLHATLLDTLSRTGWTTRVRGLAVELIRSKKVTRFEDVVETIVGLAGEKEKGSGTGLENGAGGGKKRKAGDEGGGSVHVNGNGNGTSKKAKTEKQEQQNGKDKNKDKDGDKHKDKEKNSKINGVKSSTSGSEPDYDVRIPSAVVSQGANYLRDTLDDLVTFGPDSEDTGEADDGGDKREMTNGKTK